MTDTEQNNQQTTELKSTLWNIANTLRGKMGADEFRDYCLGLIFYKYLSEKFITYAKTILENDPDIDYEKLDVNDAQDIRYIRAVMKSAVDTIGYGLYPAELFHTIAQRVKTDPKGEDKGFILEDLGSALTNIERSTQGTKSAEDFHNLFEDLDLTNSKLGNTPKARNELIGRILIHLNGISFNLSQSNSDILGDAYEYMIGEFASGAGKKAGEFYTPQPVSTLLAKIVTAHKKQLRNVYDPTCGSGSLLLRVKREVGKVGKIYGQEMNRTTYNLARMNMILHNVHFAEFEIMQEDTLEHPQHLDMKFEAIVANPPFSAKWSASELFTTDERFSQYGKLAPSSKADFAFVQHMYHHLDDDGVMAVVLPHGVLFRGAAEGHIRQYFLENLNAIDAIIGLPANIFYGTSIPTCILVLKKNRKIEDKILFIDASAEFDKVKTQNILLPEHIDKIIDCYLNCKEIDRYSAVISMQDIQKNNWNLNIPRYVDTFEAEEEIDINTVAKELAEIEQEITVIDQQILKYCKELGITAPVKMDKGL